MLRLFSFRELIGKLLKIGVINAAGALGFFQSALQLLDQSAGDVDRIDVLGLIWSTVATSLLEHINMVGLHQL